MDKIDFKKELKHLYRPSTRAFEVIDVPPMQFLMIDGQASGNFHRASSAVEGRNGALSQSYHNGRGLTSRRLGALTVIHNYDTRRRDGSTPAERLYGVQFPDLFDWLLDQMEDLPLPRQSRPRTIRDPLAVDAVAA